MSAIQSSNATGILGAAIGTGVAGAAMFNLAPLFLAAAAERFTLSDQQIGGLISVEVAGIALASFAGLFLVPRFGCRRIGTIGLVVIVVGNLVANRAPDYWTLLILRFVIGFCGDGMAYVAAIMALGRLPNPTRGFALLSLSNMVFAGSSLALLPQLAGGAHWSNITVWISATALVGSILIRGLPGPEGNGHDARLTLALFSRVGTLALVGLLMFSINLGAVWGYAERIGSASGLGIEKIGFYLSISLAFQGLGSLTAAVISTGTDRRLLLFAVLGLQLVALGMLAWSDSGAAFLVAISMWGFSWNIGIANILGIVAGLPNGGRVLALAPGTEAVGISLGPAIAAAMIAPGAYAPVMLIGATSAALSIGTIVIVTHLSDSRRRHGIS